MFCKINIESFKYTLKWISAIPSLTAFEKNGLKVNFNFERTEAQPAVLMITLNATNSNTMPMNEFVFQAAVPKV